MLTSRSLQFENTNQTVSPSVLSYKWLEKRKHPIAWWVHLSINLGEVMSNLTQTEQQGNQQRMRHIRLKTANCKLCVEEMYIDTKCDRPTESVDYHLHSFTRFVPINSGGK